MTTQELPAQERERFEAWYEADAYPLEHSNWFRRDEDGDYELAYVQASWNAWQARAALAAQAEPQAPHEAFANAWRAGFLAAQACGVAAHPAQQAEPQADAAPDSVQPSDGGQG